MNLTDLFGEGANISEEVLSIPLANLYTTGLSVGNVNKQSLVTALLLLAHSYFQGELVDYDGDPIVDDDDQPIAYDQNIAEPDCNFQFLQKKLSLDDSQLFWDYMISFYYNA